MITNERQNALINGAIPDNEEEYNFIANYREFDFKRFQVLLRGDDVPKNEKEKMWLENYYTNSRDAIEESLDRDRDYHNRLIQASKEMYSLLTATLPKDFFCKKPVSVKTAKKVWDICLFEANIKFQTIIHNPFLRKKYDILLNANPTEFYYWGIVPELREELFAKHFKINTNKLAKIYKKYVTQDFIEKVKAIESKYDVHLGFGNFDAYQWVTGYYEYRECAKYYGWE